MSACASCSTESRVSFSCAVCESEVCKDCFTCCPSCKNTVCNDCQMCNCQQVAGDDLGAQMFAAEAARLQKPKSPKAASVTPAVEPVTEPEVELISETQIVSEEAPVEDDVAAPVEDDVAAPVEDDVAAPVEDDVAAPVEDVAEPVKEPAVAGQPFKMEQDDDDNVDGWVIYYEGNEGDEGDEGDYFYDSDFDSDDDVGNEEIYKRFLKTKAENAAQAMAARQAAASAEPVAETEEPATEDAEPQEAATEEVVAEAEVETPEEAAE